MLCHFAFLIKSVEKESALDFLHHVCTILKDPKLAYANDDVGRDQEKRKDRKKWFLIHHSEIILFTDL